MSTCYQAISDDWKPSVRLGRNVDGMISIILATRKRPQILHDLINSIEQTTANLSRIECLISYDLDDECPTPRDWVYPLGRPRGTNLARDYHNWSFDYSSGGIIFVLNDDCHFITSGWDEIVRNNIDPNLPQYGQTKPINPSLSRHDPEAYSEFPIVTRKMVEALGYLMPNEYGGWGADRHLYRIAHSYSWVVPLSIEVNHLRVQDETHSNMSELSCSR